MSIYVPIRDAAKYPKSLDRQQYKKISRRFVELALKGMKFEAMEAQAVVVEKKPVVAEGLAQRMNGIPICCDRPMVDYGEFRACMLCGGKVLTAL